MRPKPRKKKQRAVVDTNVVVAGISGFRDEYISGQIPSADLLHRWAEEEHLVWLYSEEILAEYKEVLKRRCVLCLCRGRECGLHLHSQRKRLSTEPPESESHPAVAAKSLRKAPAGRAAGRGDGKLTLQSFEAPDCRSYVPSGPRVFAHDLSRKNRNFHSFLCLQCLPLQCLSPGKTSLVPRLNSSPSARVAGLALLQNARAHNAPSSLEFSIDSMWPYPIVPLARQETWGAFPR